MIHTFDDYEELLMNENTFQCPSDDQLQSLAVAMNHMSIKERLAMLQVVRDASFQKAMNYAREEMSDEQS